MELQVFATAARVTISSCIYKSRRLSTMQQCILQRLVFGKMFRAHDSPSSHFLPSIYDKLFDTPIISLHLQNFWLLIPQSSRVVEGCWSHSQFLIITTLTFTPWASLPIFSHHLQKMEKSRIKKATIKWEVGRPLR